MTLFDEFDLTVSNSKNCTKIAERYKREEPLLLAIAKDSTAWRGLKRFLSLQTNSLGSRAESAMLINNVNVRL